MKSSKKAGKPAALPAASPAPGTTAATEPRAKIRQLAEFMWHQYPGHYDGAYSKVLVGPDTPGASLVDFRISTYLPNGHVDVHLHPDKEQIYYFMEGEGILELDGRREIVRPQSYAFIPPNVSHALFNTGNHNLVFVVVTVPLNKPVSAIPGSKKS